MSTRQLGQKGLISRRELNCCQVCVEVSRALEATDNDSLTESSYSVPGVYQALCYLRDITATTLTELYFRVI